MVTMIFAAVRVALGSRAVVQRSLVCARVCVCACALAHGRTRQLRSYVIEQARLLRQKNENRYLAVLVAARGVNRCRKALFGAASRPDTPTAVLGGETVEH